MKTNKPTNKKECICECGSPYCETNTCTHEPTQKVEKIEKLHDSDFKILGCIANNEANKFFIDWQNEMQLKINEIIDHLNEASTKK